MAKNESGTQEIEVGGKGSSINLSMATKTTDEAFPYKTYLNILHGPLELIDVQKLADACTDTWYNQTLCKVNDSVVRVGVIQGVYHWHEHKDIDEFFFRSRRTFPDRSRRSHSRSGTEAGLCRAQTCAS